MYPFLYDTAVAANQPDEDSSGDEDDKDDNEKSLNRETGADLDLVERGASDYSKAGEGGGDADADTDVLHLLNKMKDKRLLAKRGPDDAEEG